ncbi:dr1-associated corepressor [Drosophila miranda]|uniref:dr1-associated corepressor n=1 Tax=Drosophila miranda TaxID=7229 RepID=UPI0007E7DBF3|nr:dr1-associated corepressor [Drosophila miranda]
MPSKKKKYNARFPAGRIKKIMQSDEEIGKVAQAVPVIISRTLELFVESLLTKTMRITNSRNAKTLSTSHMKQCIMSEQRFDFLKELVRNIPDISVAEEASSYNDDSSPEQYPDSDTPYDLSLPSTSMRSLPNGGGSAIGPYMRSMSLNGTGLKRQQQQQQYPPPTHIPSVSVPSVAHTHQLQMGHVPAKLARSESTPSYTPRGRPPNQNSYHKKQSHDTAIPAPICSYELNKPIVKIDYSNVQMPTTNLCTPEAEADANSAFNFDIAAPVINIDLTNIVAAGTAGKSSAPIIPKATVASTTPTETIFELDEDYDNI